MHPRDGRASSWSPVPIVVLVAVVLGTALTLAVRRTRLLPGERAVMEWSTTHLGAALDGFGPPLDVAFTGMAPPLLFLLLGAVVWWRWGRYPAGVFFVAGSVTGLTKIADLAHRPRPTDDLEWGGVVFGQGGYPSGHVVYTVMVFGALIHLAARHEVLRSVRLMVYALSTVLIVTTGPSRLVEVEHWPADVVAGYLIGAGGLAATVWLADLVPSLAARRAPRLLEIFDMAGPRPSRS
jgi:membrane-associated phospholipid phosphatase